jgi:hypothetical protein
MTPERWLRLNNLAHEAIQLDEERRELLQSARSMYVLRVCARITATQNVARNPTGGTSSELDAARFPVHQPGSPLE